MVGQDGRRALHQARPARVPAHVAIALAALCWSCRQTPRLSLTVHHAAGGSEAVRVGVPVYPGDHLSLDFVSRGGAVAAAALEPSVVETIPATGTLLRAEPGSYSFADRVGINDRPGMARIFVVRCDAPLSVDTLAASARGAVASAGEPIRVGTLGLDDRCEEAFATFEILRRPASSL